MPDVWVKEAASQFKNRVVKTLEGALRVKHRCAVANSPWSNGNMCEWMMREVVRAMYGGPNYPIKLGSAD